jgi:hypothetical protein
MEYTEALSIHSAVHHEAVVLVQSKVRIHGVEFLEPNIICQSFA